MTAGTDTTGSSGTSGSTRAEHAERTETIDPTVAESLRAVLDLPGQVFDPAVVAPMWHLTYLLDRRNESELGLDGHPTSGIPAPPGSGRRRMFAGGRVTHHRLLRTGAPAMRRTWVLDTKEKAGSSGPLTFVTVRNEFTQDGEIAIVDDQDIVYRGSAPVEPTDVIAPNPSPHLQVAGPSTLTADRLELDVDPILLFRFSALTFNSHRIHYDLNYAAFEGYAGLVVHGPLQVLAMAELLRNAGHDLVGREFSYRLVAPMIGAQRLEVELAHYETGQPVGVTVRGTDGRTTATGALA